MDCIKLFYHITKKNNSFMMKTISDINELEKVLDTKYPDTLYIKNNKINKTIIMNGNMRYLVNSDCFKEYLKNKNKFILSTDIVDSNNNINIINKYLFTKHKERIDLYSFRDLIVRQFRMYTENPDKPAAFILSDINDMPLFSAICDIDDTTKNTIDNCFMHYNSLSDITSSTVKNIAPYLYRDYSDNKKVYNAHSELDYGMIIDINKLKVNRKKSRVLFNIVYYELFGNVYYNCTSVYIDDRTTLLTEAFLDYLYNNSECTDICKSIDEKIEYVNNNMKIDSSDMLILTCRCANKYELNIGSLTNALLETINPGEQLNDNFLFVLSDIISNNKWIHINKYATHADAYEYINENALYNNHSLYSVEYNFNNGTGKGITLKYKNKSHSFQLHVENIDDKSENNILNILLRCNVIDNEKYNEILCAYLIK